MTHGSPTDEEVAAVVVAITASVSALVSEAGRARPTARWWSRRVLHVTEHITERGPGAWLMGRVR